MGDPTTDRLEDALADVDWPVAKQELVAHVESRETDEEVLGALRALPLADYDNAEQVIRSVPTADARHDARS